MKKFFNDLMYWFIIVMILMAFGFFLIGMLMATGIVTMFEWFSRLFKNKSDNMTDRNGHLHRDPRSGPQRGSPLGVTKRTL